MIDQQKGTEAGVPGDDLGAPFSLPALSKNALTRRRPRPAVVLPRLCRGASPAGIYPADANGGSCIGRSRADHRGLGDFQPPTSGTGYIPVHCLPLPFLTASAGYTLDFLPDRLYNNLVIIAPYNGRSQDKKGVFAMKKAEFWKGFGVGFTILLLLMCLCMTAFAASKRTIDVEDGIGISINGATFIPRDAAGNQVSVFIYNGTTYAPVRAIGEAMGLDVKFDSANRKVQLTTQDRLLAQSGASGSYISADRAKEIALADAGLKEGNAVFLKVKLERDDGRYQYDVEFYSGTTEYDYEIDAITGKILSAGRELDDFIVPADTSGGSAGNGIISADRAKEIALADAKVNANDAVFKKVKLDRDDGRLEYEVEFYAGSMEYEYEINAETGSIISRDIESHN